jgi:hypothetical protein
MQSLTPCGGRFGFGTWTCRQRRNGYGPRSQRANEFTRSDVAREPAARIACQSHLRACLACRNLARIITANRGAPSGTPHALSPSPRNNYCTYHGIKLGSNSPAFEGGSGDSGIFSVERRQTPCDIRRTGRRQGLCFRGNGRNTYTGALTSAEWSTATSRPGG